MTNEKNEFFTYKGKPLVKKNNQIFYGSMLDDYVVMMQIIDEKVVDEETVPNNILVQLLLTDKDVSPIEAVVKKSEKIGMYSALEIADIWLTRALSE